MPGCLSDASQLVMPIASAGPSQRSKPRVNPPASVVIPGMSSGATDGLYLRNVGVPVFGIAGLQMQSEDDRSHGLDERVPVASLYKAREYWYQLVKALTTTSTRAM